jgi:Mg-chelatase subunit ChlD
MHDTDEMCIIVFNNSAQLLIPFTRTNKAGKTMLRGKVKQMQAGGATNIWDGIKVALDHLGKVGGNYNTFMVLLTDGEPNINPPRGIVPTMEKYLKIENMEVPNIHVFGYGYELDTQLLMEIANVGNGTYTYIPDCSMVGTAFINFMANCLSCYTNRIQLTLQPPPGLKLRILGCNSLVYNPGILLYGRPRNIIIRCQP